MKRHLKLLKLNNKLQLTSNVDVYGDSISTNYGGVTSWINQLASDKNLIVTNYAISGTGVKLAQNKASMFIPEIPVKDVLFFTGFNNTRVLVDSGQKNTIEAAYRTMLTYLYTNQIEFPYGAPGTGGTNNNMTINGLLGSAGTVAELSNYGSRTVMFRNSTILGANWYKATNNNTTSYIECKNLIGDNIVIATWITKLATLSVLEIVIDGVVNMTFDGNSKFTSINADGFIADYINDVIIIRGLSNGNHTVRINFKTANKIAHIDFIGVLKNNDRIGLKKAIVLSFPHMNNTGYTYVGGETNASILDAATLSLKTNIQANFPNYPIKFVDIHQNGLFYEPTTNPLHVQVDGVHPTTLGNTKIKDAVKTVLI